MKLKSLIVGLFIVVFLLSVCYLSLLKQTFATKLVYQGQSITISRDEHNIPEIHAPNYQAALYSLAYATAQDRLFQIAFRRQMVQGKLSKFLGQKTIDIDKMFREINLYGWAVKCAERLYRENITQYNGYLVYAKGINDYVKTLKIKPLQFYMIGLEWQDWTVTDIFAIYKLLKWSLSYGAVDEYVRSQLLNKFTKEQVDAFMPYEPKYWLNGKYATRATIVKEHQIPQDILKKSENLKQTKFDPIKVEEMLQIGFFQYLDLNQRASNSWAISGKHTESGHALLANDPHLDATLPGECYQAKIFYLNKKGEQVYVIGATFVGVPAWIGKTSYASITFTVNYLDSQDLFKETIKDQKYLFDGIWRQLKSRTQIISVKNAEPIIYKVYQTHRGPLIKYISSKSQLYKIKQPISICWSGFTDVQYVSLVPFSHSPQIQTKSELLYFLQELGDYAPSFNLIYSTKDDHIGYQATGVIPLRRNPHSGMYVKDGSVSDHDWVGFIQGKDRLHVQDPERGYITSANNKAAPAKYFNGILDISMYTARADRVQQLIQDQIKSGRKLNIQFMRKLQLDTVDSYCLQLVQGMRQKIATGNQNYKFLYSVFQKFDCNFDSESTIASFYLTFLQNIYEQLHPQGVNTTVVLSHFVSHYQYLYNFLLKNHTVDQLKRLNNSMFDAVYQLRTFFGSQNPQTYKYGMIHRDYMIHRPFSGVQSIKFLFENYAKGFGNQNTLNVGLMNRFHLKDYRTNHRAILRVIMSYFQNSQWIIDGGSSQKFYSKHYKDQTELFLTGKYLLMDAWNRTNIDY